MLAFDLKSVYLANRQTHPAYLRNVLKERLQLYVLQFVSVSPWSRSLIFKGGTCLRFFFDLPRLSEDLDFDIMDGANFRISTFEKAIAKHFVSTLQFTGLATKMAGNGRTLYLKFPILDQIGLGLTPSDSRILFVRLDFAPALGRTRTIELATKSTLNFSLIIQRYALADLMAGKIAAILQRENMEGTNKMKPRFKGRDYYDLIWYLEKNVRPNWAFVKELTGLTRPIVIRQLKIKFAQADPAILQADLAPFFPNPEFISSFSQNINSLFIGYLGQLSGK